MTAYNGAGQWDNVLLTFKKARMHFKETSAGRGRGGSPADLGAIVSVCLDAGLLDQAALLAREAIAYLGRGGCAGDDVEWVTCFRCLSEVYQRQGSTEEAIENQLTALANVPYDEDVQETFLSELVRLLLDVEDLRAYAAAFDRQSTEGGYDRPLLRKALGLAFLEILCRLLDVSADTFGHLLIH